MDALGEIPLILKTNKFLPWTPQDLKAKNQMKQTSNKLSHGEIA